MYQALYRKYRPSTFDDVVGQEHIVTTLKNEIIAGRPSHAYLFMGSRGTGKTTCSKLVAKAVNCLNPQHGNPCGICNICTGIDNGSVVDVLEIDAASWGGVDNIRELREEAGFTPNLAKYRVYIIDEAHMLSTGAFNALLKIMEEPPPHVIFILATTEVHKVPATILSRCQRFDFRRIDSKTIQLRLLEIAGKEEIRLQEDAALLIARLADGGMRDALSILDLCSSEDREITVEYVSMKAGLADQGYLFDMSGAVLGQDAGSLLELIDKAAAHGLEYDRLCEQLISHYRNLMVARSAKKPEELIVCLPEVLEMYKNQAALYPVAGIMYALKVLQDALAAMARSSSRRAELEMTAVKLCDSSLDTSPEAILDRLDRLEGIIRSGAVVKKPTSSLEQAVNHPPKSTEEKRDTQEQAEFQVTEPMSESAVEPFPLWNKVLEKLQKLNPMLYGFLSGSGAYISGERILIDSKNQHFLKYIRTNEGAKDHIKQAISEVTGRSMNIGPYKTKTATSAPKVNKLDKLINDAISSGVEVNIN